MPLTALVNNASAFQYDSVALATRESWDMHMEPNLRAPLVLSQALAAQIPAGSRDGAIINMIDQRVWNLTEHFISYTASKYALWGLTKQLALALAPQGIRVNGIGPGVVPTKMAFNTKSASGTQHSESLRALQQTLQQKAGSELSMGALKKSDLSLKKGGSSGSGGWRWS